MTDTPQMLLAHHLKTLKLPTFLREYDKIARQCAAEGVDHVRYLLRLAELELIDRERRMVERRIRQAKFPTPKSLDSFDFKAIASLNKMLVLELARCAYIERRENVIALGNSGTGKSHIALGLAIRRLPEGARSGSQAAAALVHEPMEARDEKRPSCASRDSWRNTACWSTSLDSCGSPRPAPNCSRCSASATNAAPSWSLPTCRSMAMDRGVRRAADRRAARPPHPITVHILK